MSYSEMGEVWSRYVRARCETAVKALTKREFDARFFPGREEVVRAVMEIIPPDAGVGCGGSWTTRQIGLLDALRERGNPVYAHEPGMDFEEATRVRREALLCPYYLCSANAVTLRGELVNTDGIGNRVAGTSFGPGTVIIVAGYNKLVPDLDAAFERIKEVAAPANAVRYGMAVPGMDASPCVQKGRCYDCTLPSSICRITTIIRQRPMMTDFKVFLVGESLGF
ncbi:MAG: lactate utilization protein [Actinobacteria bacterium]|nr:lactate utilization protein [Actinomycetota bacterium]